MTRKITRLHLARPLTVKGAGVSRALSAGGIPGASAAFAFEPGDIAGFPGVICHHRGGEPFFVPITSIDRIDLEGEADEADPEVNDARLRALESLTVAELRERAKGKVEGYSTMKKDELVAALAVALAKDDE